MKEFFVLLEITKYFTLTW